jgi:hypothetical protein
MFLSRRKHDLTAHPETDCRRVDQAIWGMMKLSKLKIESSTKLTPASPFCHGICWLAGQKMQKATIELEKIIAGNPYVYLPKLVTTVLT